MEEPLQNADVYFIENFDDVLDPVTQKAKSILMRNDTHLNLAGRRLVASNFADQIVAVIREPSTVQLVAVSLVTLLSYRKRAARSKQDRRVS
jgi:hypothetical protein